MRIKVIFAAILLILSGKTLCMKKSFENLDLKSLENLGLEKKENKEPSLSKREKCFDSGGSIELCEVGLDEILKKKKEEIAFCEMFIRSREMLLGKGDSKGEFDDKLKAKAFFLGILDKRGKLANSKGKKEIMDRQKSVLCFQEEAIETFFEKYRNKLK